MITSNMKQINISVYTNWRKSISVVLIGVNVLLVFINYQKESSTKNEIYQNVYKIIQNKAMFVIVLKKQQFIKQPEYIIIKLGNNMLP